eukprot:GHVS01042715.1.p1 GENE.GHVS01042715.1~~GHVS01042715.1.p1  ORF type:complete len:357 (+),score=101.30 GHVS01042715.1:75-1145(+)
MGKAKGEVNPTDKYRKQLREKEKKRNKGERKRLREEAALRRNPEGVRDELTVLEQQRDRGQLDPKGYKRLSQLTGSWEQIKQKAASERNSLIWREQEKEQQEDELRKTKQQQEQQQDEDNSDEDSDDDITTTTIRPPVVPHPSSTAVVTTTPLAIVNSHVVAVQKVIASLPLEHPQTITPTAPPLFSSVRPPPLPSTRPPNLITAFAPPLLHHPHFIRPLPLPSSTAAFHAIGLATLAALRPPPPPVVATPPTMNSTPAMPIPSLPTPTVEQPPAKPPPAQLFVPTQLRVHHKESPNSSSSANKFMQKQMSSLQTVTAFSVGRTTNAGGSASGGGPKVSKDIDDAFATFLKEVGEG